MLIHPLNATFFVEPQLMSKSKLFITELTDDTPVESIFLVANKTVRETRNGDPYLCITLQDRTGTIEARCWDDALTLDARFASDDFIALRGRVSSYRGELQITVTDVERIPEDTVELSDYLPHSQWSAEVLLTQLFKLVDEEIKSEEVRRFLLKLFDDESFKKSFSRAPAAVSNHHAYLAGLLEHSLSMARLAVSMGRHYEAYYPGLLDTDLVVAGCIIHDMAKIDELEYRRAFDYSTEGRLIGHIVRGAELVGEVAASLDPPLDDHLTTQLKHLVLSHHGKKEYGAPVTPKSPEALLLHHLDLIDSRMNMCWNACKGLLDEPSTKDGWSDYQRNFNSFLYIAGEAAAGWRSPPLQAPAEEGPGIHPGAPSFAGKPQPTDVDGQSSVSDDRDSSHRDNVEAKPATADHNLKLFGD